MIFPLRKVIDFAMKKPVEVDRAYTQVFGSLPFSDLKQDWEELFLEWLIFDYKLSSGATFLIEYVLRNPDKLSEGTLNQFEQIVKTQFYSQFEILNIKKGEWVEVENLFTGKVYKVSEKKGSETLSEKGVIPGRIAKVEGKWYLVGANSIYFPITHTERAKKNMRKLKIKNFSPKDTIKLLRSQEKSSFEPIKIPTKRELKEKRKKLKEEYEVVIEKFKATLLFADLVEAIYKEERVNVLDFWKNLEKSGLKFEMLIENTSLFQDIWNYFPHKCLGNKSPIEIFAEFKEKGTK
ncbi:MAG: hypothetical protein Q7K55_03560 [Candidatus Levybacteria bacterium]|nr:hypothetical protein [Candidatus Levybacteria bacterium]